MNTAIWIRNIDMDKRHFRIFISAISVIMLIPVICSCSLFRKKAVAEAAVLFGKTICTGDAADIIRKTD